MQLMIKSTLSIMMGAVLCVAQPATASEESTIPSGHASSNVFWTAEQMRFVAKGDLSNGARLNAEAFCASCHGAAGVAPSANWPSLAGQRAEYTFKMLKDYKDAKRGNTAHNEIMVLAASILSDQDMADLAKYYASFELPQLPEGIKSDIQAAEAASKLVVRGDGARLIAPCQSCHGSIGEGSVTDTPSLAGQTPEYFKQTMLEYRDGKRHNDIYGRMRLISQQLSDDEINALAHYYAGLTAAQ